MGIQSSAVISNLSWAQESRERGPNRKKFSFDHRQTVRRTDRAQVHVLSCALQLKIVIFAPLDPHSGHNRKWGPSDICCLYPSPVANDCLITYHSQNRLLQITNRVSCGAYVRDNYFPIAHWEREKCVLVTNCRVSGVNVTREKSKYFSDVRQKWVIFWTQNFLS